MKKILLFLIVLILAVSMSSCFLFDFLSSDNIEEDWENNAWGQINQNVKRADDWHKYVQNSKFQLGKKYFYYPYEDSDEIMYEVKYGTYPSIDGSTVAVPMAMEFARQHLDINDDDLPGFVTFNTTHYAYENLILSRSTNYYAYIDSKKITMESNRPVDIIIATEPSDEELKFARDNDVELLIKPVCYDAFVFITHKDNPVDSLTIEQIQKIYSGEIKNWKDVGGDDLNIEAYQREKNSGSQTAMENLVMKGVEMISPKTANIFSGMGGMIDAVAEYQNNKYSIGYTYKYYIDLLYKNENIKVIKINGVSPEPKNLRSGEYGLTTNYYGVIRKEDETSVGGKFLDWMISGEGQKCIEQAGYIPME